MTDGALCSSYRIHSVVVSLERKTGRPEKVPFQPGWGKEGMSHADKWLPKGPVKALKWEGWKPANLGSKYVYWPLHHSFCPFVTAFKTLHLKLKKKYSKWTLIASLLYIQGSDYVVLGTASLVRYLIKNSWCELYTLVKQRYIFIKMCFKLL